MVLSALRPPMIFGALRRIFCRSWFFIPAKRALRPGMIFASPASQDELPGLASADDLRRLASFILRLVSNCHTPTLYIPNYFCFLS